MYYNELYYTKKRTINFPYTCFIQKGLIFAGVLNRLQLNFKWPMLIQILDIKPTTLEEFYIHLSEIEKLAYRSFSDFMLQISSSITDTRSVVIKTLYRINNSNDDLISTLKTSTEFELSGLANDIESENILEQCIYIAYSEMLKQHKIKYQHWPVFQHDIALPDNRSVVREIRNILENLPY